VAKFGNLLFAGLTSGAIYAVFAVCLSLWYRVANILNLAIGDFAMLGALSVDYLVRVEGWPLALSIITAAVAIGVVAYLYDTLVLRLALDGLHPQRGIVVIFFYTFALSFFLEGVAEQVFGTDVHGAPALWNGNALKIGSANIQRAGVLVLGLAIVVGIALTLFLRFTGTGKAVTACGDNVLGAKIVGIDARRFRVGIFIGTAMLAALFGILESPLNGFVYNSGAAISLTGTIAAAFAGFRRPGKAVIAGLLIGVLEAFLGGYVNTQYGETILYGLLAAVILIRPEVMGLARAEPAH
jgi:branched-subunit amino acid ABC-type transport system permease component